MTTMLNRTASPVAAFLIALAPLVAACTGETPVNQAPPPAASAAPASELTPMIARFAPAEITANVSALPDNERQALAKLIDAARLMDSLFLRQVWSGNDALLQQLSRDALPRASDAAAAADRLHYFLINKGP